MKCGYCSNEVAKDEAVKDGRYYHKECYRTKQGKKEIEEYWLNSVNSGTIIQVLRKVIKDIAELYDVDYILWVLKKCKQNNIKLQYPQGLKGCCDKKEFKDEWNKNKLNSVTTKMRNEFENHINIEQSKFEYINRNKNFIKIL